MSLTIGMACYDDYHGVAFSVMSLLLHQNLTPKDEILVVDSNPDSNHGQNVADFCNKHRHQNVRYIPTDRKGTTQPRQQIFEEARGDLVLVIDCHVLLINGAVDALRSWFSRNSETNDILSGPLLLDSGDFHTHFNAQWRAQMWGTWGMAWKCSCGFPLTVIQDRELCQFHTIDNIPQEKITFCPACYKPLPAPVWSGHQIVLVQEGFQPLIHNSDQPYEIPGMGLGLFAAHRKAWPGFNPHFSAFGGEELYIHNKFRQRGGKALCLPFLKWWHRFGRPDGISYEIGTLQRVRNYVLGYQELGMSLDPIYQHFVSLETHNEGLKEHLIYVHGYAPQLIEGQSTERLNQLHSAQKIPEQLWNKLLEDPVGFQVKQKPSSTPAGLSDKPTLDQLYEHYRSIPRDLDQHFPLLKLLASKCNHVTEFSKRRESVVALMSGRPETMISYNSEVDPVHTRLSQIVSETQRIQGELSAHRATHVLTQAIGPFSSLRIKPIERTDLLFIDEVHHGEYLKQQLTIHGQQVNRFLVIRGTGGYGIYSESGNNQPGLFFGIKWWLQHNPEWFVAEHTTNEYGMTVLSRNPEDKPAQEIRPWPKDYGPGTELKAILASLNINPSPSCDCNARAWQMDEWGVTGCKTNRDTIILWLKEGQDRWGWSNSFSIISSAIWSGLAFKLNPLDPIPGLVDEAIRRAEEKETAASH